MFGMFSWKNEMLSIQIPEYLLGVFVDRFGKDISVRKRDSRHYIVHIQQIIFPIIVSPFIVFLLSSLHFGRRICNQHALTLQGNLFPFGHGRIVGNHYLEAIGHLS